MYIGWTQILLVLLVGLFLFGSSSENGIIKIGGKIKKSLKKFIQNFQKDFPKEKKKDRYSKKK